MKFESASQVTPHTQKFGAGDVSERKKLEIHASHSPGDFVTNMTQINSQSD